ncbi:PAAR domain-containing protein [Pseudomonas capsici]|uniref:PAAR domain-containing protein n=1 Tax=Pseudomonas capsici TaxID=2810614 RepID=UPI0021F1DC3E|nr:PAAR domain-containing protein [Pseudomonas capsici]MCV4285713.1 PAAR domain-containing protein [Pseudomonas capsici]
MAKPAARKTDPTACPVQGHGVNPIISGSPNVFFDGLPAATLGDISECGSSLVSGVSSTVFINGKPAATVGSAGVHGNVITGGSGTVIIGDVFVPAPFTPPLPMTLHYNERFILRSPDGAPYRNRKYLLVRENGIQEKGVTNDSGHTHSIATLSKSELINIYIE